MLLLCLFFFIHQSVAEEAASKLTESSDVINENEPTADSSELEAIKKIQFVESPESVIENIIDDESENETLNIEYSHEILPEDTPDSEEMKFNQDINDEEMEESGNSDMESLIDENYKENQNNLDTNSQNTQQTLNEPPKEEFSQMHDIEPETINTNIDTNQQTDTDFQEDPLHTQKPVVSLGEPPIINYESMIKEDNEILKENKDFENPFFKDESEESSHTSSDTRTLEATQAFTPYVTKTKAKFQIVNISTTEVSCKGRDQIYITVSKNISGLIYCKFKDLIVTGTRTSNDTAVFVVPKMSPGVVNISLSFERQKWTEEQMIIVIDDSDRTPRLILCGIIIFVILVIALPQNLCGRRVQEREN